MSAAPDSARAIFGDRLPLAEAYHRSLSEAGPIRGLNGPRELPVLWERHILNSAILAYLSEEVLPVGATVCDVGSGGGLPGIPLAIARPDLDITLVDPLQRRVDYLTEIVRELDLPIRVVRARAGERDSPEVIGRFDVVTSRAVAPLGRLLGWCVPLVGADGKVVAMKGRSVESEIDSLSAAERRLVARLDIVEVESPDHLHTACVVVGTPSQRPKRGRR